MPDASFNESSSRVRLCGCGMMAGSFTARAVTASDKMHSPMMVFDVMWFPASDFFGNAQRLHRFPKAAREVWNVHRRAAGGHGANRSFDDATPRRRVINDAVGRDAFAKAVEQTPGHHEIHAAVTAAL